jgi:cytochrome c-type biogenesis protein CcmH/NrfF
MSGRRRLPLALALLALAAGAPAALAVQRPQPQTTLPAMEQQVMCVVCRTPLAVANGPQAEAERRQLRRLIAAGMSEQQIKDALVAQYGERVLALPKDDGFNLAVYLVPVLAVVFGLLLLAVSLPRWRRRARAPAEAPAAPGAPAPTADELRRLDEELAQRD